MKREKEMMYLAIEGTKEENNALLCLLKLSCRTVFDKVTYWADKLIEIFDKVHF